MRHLFVRTLLAFLVALLVMVASLAAVLQLGFRRSIQDWNRARLAEVERFAEAVLRGEADQQRPPENVPVFVFDPARELVYTNRGQARRLQGEDAPPLAPVERAGKLLGYYYTTPSHFLEDQANERLLHTMRRAVLAGLGISLGVSLLFALGFSRSLSAPAVEVARGIDRLAGGALAPGIPERGAEELARIARSANRLARQLAREQDVRRQWLQDIVHDLRTPVSALKAQFEAMQDGVLPVTPERIRRNVVEVRRIEGLVSGLEELMRLESPEMTAEAGEVSGDSLLAELTDRFALEAERKGIRLEADNRAGFFRADHGLLLRAASNLVANALRHAPQGGRVAVVILRRQGEVALRVTNSGPPVPEVELERVFDRLFRGEYARSSSGSGLGLTIARRIAELHGGGARLWNEPGGVAAELTLAAR